jgi:hypothetical protein
MLGGSILYSAIRDRKQQPVKKETKKVTKKPIKKSTPKTKKK